MALNLKRSGTVEIRIDKKTASIEFAHPKANTMNSHLLQSIASSIQELSNKEELRVLVLKSKGQGAFCGGASLDEMKTFSTRKKANTFFEGFGHLIRTMSLCKKPIIGRVHGKVVGGGLGLVAACDYVFASEAASIKLSELSIGLTPSVIAPAIQRKAGVSTLSQLMLNPTKWYESRWAEQRGIYHEVYPSIEEVDVSLQSFANQLALFSNKVLEHSKKLLWEGTENWAQLLKDRAAASGQLSLSEPCQQFLKNHVNKDGCI